MHIEVIFFDWGGTLAEVARQAESLREGIMAAGILTGSASADPNAGADRLLEAFAAADAQAALDPRHREFDMAEVVAHWAASINHPLEADELARVCDVLGRRWIGALDPLPGALEAVRTLKNRGLRLGLVSNCSVPPLYCRQAIQRQGFGPLLDFTLFSSEIGYRKPAPAIYAEALRRAFPHDRPGDLANVLFVGDSPACDVLAPAAAGMKTALVKCRKGIWPASDYQKAKPDLRLDAVADLPARLD